MMLVIYFIGSRDKLYFVISGWLDQIIEGFSPFFSYQSWSSLLLLINVMMTDIIGLCLLWEHYRLTLFVIIVWLGFVGDTWGICGLVIVIITNRLWLCLFHDYSIFIVIHCHYCSCKRTYLFSLFRIIETGNSMFFIIISPCFMYH